MKNKLVNTKKHKKQQDTLINWRIESRQSRWNNECTENAEMSEKWFNFFIQSIKTK